MNFTTVVVTNLLFLAALFTFVPPFQLVYALNRPPLTSSIINATGYEVLQCATGRAFNDSRIGYFDNKNAAYCDPKCSRSPIVCCVPEKPDVINLKYRLYTSRSPDAVFVEWDNDTGFKHLTSGKVIFIIHGFSESLDHVQWINETKDAWLAYDPQATVITVDWREANQLFYFQVVANIRTVGAMVGYSLWKWQIWDRTDLVGFSLGAHVVGEAGRFIQNKGHLVDHCTGLDTAGITFDGCSDEIRLKKSDCRLVESIHSTGSPRNSKTVTLGTNRRTGHCDYYVNSPASKLVGRSCGYTQYPCFNPDVKALTKGLFSLLLSLDDSTLMHFVVEDNAACGHYMATKVYIKRLKLRGSAQKCPLCSNCGRGFFETCRPDAGQTAADANPLPPDSGCNSMFTKSYIYNNY